MWEGAKYIHLTSTIHKFLIILQFESDEAS